MQIECPFCGQRDLREFTYVGDALRDIPALSESEEAWVAYVYERQNPRGRHREFWQHTYGCRQFLTIERDTVTHEIFAVTAIGPYAELAI